MESRDWRTQAIFIVVALYIIFGIGLFFTHRQYETLIQNQTNGFAQTIANVVESKKNAVVNTLNSLEFETMSESAINGYLEIWTEGTRGISKLTYIDENYNEYAYSTYQLNALKNSYVEDLVYRNAKNSASVYMQYDSDSSIIIYAKPIYNETTFKGVLVAEYEIEDLINEINKFSLDIHKYYVQIKDLYGFEIYNSEVAEETVEKTPFSQVYTIESNGKGLFKYINYLKPNLARRKGLQNKDKITAKESTPNGTFEIVITCDVDESAYGFQTRLIYVIAGFFVLTFLIGIVPVFVVKNEAKKKLYVFIMVLYEAIVCIYFIQELYGMNIVIDRYINVQADIVQETMKIEKETSGNIGYLLSNVVNYNDELSKKYGLNLSKINNETFYNFKRSNDLIMKIEVTNKNDNVIYSYPNNIDTLDKELEINKEKYLSVEYDIKNLNNKLKVIFAIPSYIDVYGKNDFLYEYDYDEDLTLEEEKERLIINEKITRIHNKYGIIKLYKIDSIGGYLLEYDEDRLLNIYNFTTENKFKNILYCLLTVFIVTLIIANLAYIISVRRRNQKTRYEKMTRDDGQALERLLRKINDDVSQISKSYRLDDDDDLDLDK